jgi:hypothetical protein
MNTMPERLNNYDWEEAFGYAGKPDPIPGFDGSAASFAREDVVAIHAIDDGANDGDEWIGVFELADGRFACLRAGCDYTGWD